MLNTRKCKLLKSFQKPKPKKPCKNKNSINNEQITICFVYTLKMIFELKKGRLVIPRWFMRNINFALSWEC